MWSWRGYCVKRRECRSRPSGKDIATMERSRLAVIGVGHLGKEHARILAGHSGVELVGVVDARTEQAEAIAQRCQTRAFSDHKTLLDKIDAAVLAVPTVHHHAVACDCLQAGVSLL